MTAKRSDGTKDYSKVGFGSMVSCAIDTVSNPDAKPPALFYASHDRE